MSAGEGAEELKVASIGAGSSHSAVLISGQGALRAAAFPRRVWSIVGRFSSVQAARHASKPLIVALTFVSALFAVACGSRGHVASFELRTPRIATLNPSSGAREQ